MARTANRRRDQSGGAISLWTVLMVPVAAFAAVVAIAGPQRMAAESSVEEAAGDLAALAVVMRDGRNLPEDELEGFLPDCPDLALSAAPTAAEINQQVQLKEVCDLLLGDDATAAEGYLRRDLGYLGIDTSTWEGFYSDSVAPLVPCLISDNRQTTNAVYVAIAADWEDAGWAAAQAWPEGVRVGSELVARLNRDTGSSTLSPCDPDDLSPPPNPLNPPARTVFSD